MLLLGGSTTPWAALLGGVLVGVVIGAAQWLALRPAVGIRWLIATAAAVTLGGFLAALVVGPPVTTTCSA